MNVSVSSLILMPQRGAAQLAFDNEEDNYHAFVVHRYDLDCVSGMAPSNVFEDPPVFRVGENWK